MKKRMPAKIKEGWYDPADYIMVHKDHYRRLLEASQTRIEIVPTPRNPDQCFFCDGFHGANMPCPKMAPMCSSDTSTGDQP